VLIRNEAGDDFLTLFTPSSLLSFVAALYLVGGYFLHLLQPSVVTTPVARSSYVDWQREFSKKEKELYSRVLRHLKKIATIKVTLFIAITFINTFAAIVDLSGFNNSCLRLLKISDDNE
jgi:nicotinamide riboside transporter PnuC